MIAYFLSWNLRSKKFDKEKEEVILKESSPR